MESLLALTQAQQHFTQVCGNFCIRPGFVGGLQNAQCLVVERDGTKQSFHITNVNAVTLRPIMQAQISAKARLMTDEARVYPAIGTAFASHESVNHSAKEYARGDVTTNTVESSFAILKRGLYGTFHSVSEQHLQRYCAEFDFKWNTRTKLGYDDVQRTNAALRGIVGKRLTYRRLDAQAPI